MNCPTCDTEYFMVHNCALGSDLSRNKVGDLVQCQRSNLKFRQVIKLQGEKIAELEEALQNMMLELAEVRSERVFNERQRILAEQDDDRG